MKSISSLIEWYSELGIEQEITNAPASLATPNINSIQKKEKGNPHNLSGTKQTEPLQNPNKIENNSIQNEQQLIKQLQTDLLPITTIQQLYKFVLNFKSLPICTTAHSTSFARGNEQSVDILVIGDIPSNFDDRNNTALGGNIEVLLNKMLISVINPDEFKIRYINAIPWRPPGNRTLQKIEVLACAEILKKHIELTQPNFLIVLGKQTSEILFGKTNQNFRELIGQIHNYDKNIKTLVCYHPTHFVDHPKYKKLSFKSLVTLKKYLENSEN